MPALLSLLISVLLLALLLWLAFYIVDMLPLPDPPKAIVKVIVGLIALIYVLGWFVGYAPRPLL